MPLFSLMEVDMKFDLVAEKMPGHDTSGRVGKINKAPGDSVKPGDIIFTIESGKGTVDFISKYSGIIDDLLINEGDNIKKGQVAGHVTGEKSDDDGAIKKSSYSFGISKPVKKECETDVLVIGGGPGGYVAAIRASQRGLRVMLVEEDKLGGTCLNYGCIPTKSLVNSVDILQKLQFAGRFGFETGSINVSMEKIINHKKEVVSTLVSGIEHLMKVNKIDYIIGTAKAVDENTILAVNKSQEVSIKYKNLIIATGAKTFMLPVEGCESNDILTSKELLELNSVPKSITIIGGGVIGMEFAFIYRALGSEVNVIEYLPQILNSLDEDAADCIKKSAGEKGIKIYEGTCAVSIKTSLDGHKIVEVKAGDDTRYVTSERVVMAVGRKANTEALDLNKLNVRLNDKNNGIAVDEYMRTSNPHIYAIGDVTNIVQLAHVASHQGIVAADHIAGIERPMCYDAVPSVIFTQPEAGQAGMTEKEAVKKGIEYIAGRFPFAANGKALTMDAAGGFVKLIAHKASRKIIGGCVVGIHAADLISIICNLISSGATIDDASHVIYAHPTVAESVHEAILDLDGMGIHFGKY